MSSNLLAFLAKTIDNASLEMSSQAEIMMKEKVNSEAQKNNFLNKVFVVVCKPMILPVCCQRVLCNG